MTTTTTDLIQHNGKTYRLATLAHYMDDEQRDAIHGDEASDTPQGFWDAFAAKFPDEADHLVELVPEVHAVETMTLAEYVNERDGDVVLFWAGIGTPAGEHTPLGHPDMDFAERRGLLDLSGTVDEAGDWRWDGEGDPRDDRGNTIYKAHAFHAQGQWERLVEEHERGE